MFVMKTVASRIYTQAARLMKPQRRSISHLTVLHEPYEDRAKRYECLFCREDIDGWDIHQAMNDLAGMDLIPEPRIIIAALYACRRVNDYALAIRFLETVKSKCANNVNKYYPYILQEITPTLCELGIDTPEALGYDKPELFLVDVDDIH